jgi:electron transfer flavoprotein beta subunit
MLTAIKELNTPRYMTIGGIYDAVKADIPVWGAKELEVDLNKVGLDASPTNVFRSFTPAPKGKGVMIERDTVEETAKALLEMLQEKYIIA